VTADAGCSDVRSSGDAVARPRVDGARRDPESGSGTVLVLALVAAAATGIVMLSLLASAESGRSAAQSAADLAALAVAEQVAGGITGERGRASAGSGEGRASAGTGEGSPVGEDGLLVAACAVGRATAEANGCLLTSCDGLGAGVVEVTASRRTVAGVARAVARAGPQVAP